MAIENHIRNPIEWARDQLGLAGRAMESTARSAHGAQPAERPKALAVNRITAADFDAIPYLAIKGDYTATSPQCQESVDAINARRAQGQGTAMAEYMKLDEMGMLGVTHMMMLDANNLEIADLMLEWVGANVPRAPRR